MKPAHYARVAPGLVLLCAMAQAQPAESIPAANIRLAFDIHGKQLEEALTEFAQKTQLQVLFPSELVRGQSAREVSGSLTPEAALQTLLAATGLRYEYINANTIAIRPEYDLSVATLRQVRGAAPRFLADVDADSKGGDSGNTPGVEEGRASFASGGMPQVLIKGSRSLNADIERTRDDVLPYVVLDRHTIEASGASNVNDFLRSRLTMNYVPATNSQSFFIGGGSESTIALRGLGDRQTLILIDGRRGGMRGSSGGEFQADLNAIPLSAIERIEVLPATAAGIYGGDATGGVVNVVLRRDYSGVNAAVTYENSIEGGGGDKRVDLTGQTRIFGGKTTVGFRGSYSDTSPLFLEDRDFYLEYRNRARDYGLLLNPTSPFTSAQPTTGATTNITSTTRVGGVLQPLVLDDGTPLNSTITYVPYGYAGPQSDGGKGLLTHAGAFNDDPANNGQTGGAKTSLLSAPTRRSADLTLEQEVTPHVRVFLELGASRTESDLNRTTLLSFFNLSATDPANPFRQAIRVQTPVLDFPQTGVTRTETFRGLSGAIVDLSHDWRAEVDYAFDRANLRETLAATSFANAAASGAVSSGSVNVFQDINIYTTNLSTYVLPAITVNPTHSIQNDVTLRVAGPVGALPAGPIAVSVLTEYRKQEYSRYSTTDYSSGTASTSVYTPQSVAVRSAYVEGRFPLISKINALSWAESLEAQLAARYDDYHQIGGGFISAPAIDLPGAPNDLSSFDPTVGIRFQPMEDAAFRVSYGTGFTTPSLSVLQRKPAFDQPNFTRLTDPKRGSEAVGTVKLRTGASDDLRPEQSISLSSGVIFTPRFVPGLRLSFDWTRITKHDNIVNVTFNQSALNNENNLPGLVARAAPAAGDAFGVGKVIGFDSRFINATRARSDSYDIALDYKHETSAYGTFSAQLIGTQLSSNLLQLTPGAVGQERAGTYVSPKWSANGSLSWRWRGLDVQWAAQYLDSYWINADHSVVVLQASGRLGSAVYHDITAGYRFNESVRDGISAALSNLDVRVGVKNVFNRKPRYLTNNNFYYDTWSSPMMSTYYLTLQKRF